LSKARETTIVSPNGEDNPNFDKASTAALVEVATLWSQVFALAEDNWICILDYAPDHPQERTQDIVEALVKRMDYKSARDIIKKLFQVTTAIGEDCSIQRFYVLDAELAEAMGKRSDAHEAYTKASEIDTYYYRYEGL
jgi:Tfp pilus assembly protein PilF